MLWFNFLEWLTLIFSMQSRIETALTHTSGSDLILRAHCSHFLCSAWLIQHHRTTLSSSELPAQKNRSSELIKSQPVCFECKNYQTHTNVGQHLHARGLWAVPHNPAPEPDWRPCHLAKQPVYLSHLWREGRVLQKKMSWRVESAAYIVLVGRTASKQQQTML